MVDCVSNTRVENTSDVQFGHFDDCAREFVITNPKTPYPWINYLGNENFYSIISNTAGGYCFYKDAKFRRLTRYRYNNVPTDDGGRYFYICDGDTSWSPGWKPLKTPLDSYECRHGMGYTKFESKLNQLNCEVLHFVPLGENLEVIRVKLRNDSKITKDVSLFSFIEWCLWNAEDDMTNFQRNYSIGEVEIKGSTIYHKTEYRERRNHYAFYTVNTPIAGFDTSRDEFLGRSNGFHEPEVVKNRKAKNSHAHGWSPVASHAIEAELHAGEEKEYIFVLGYVENAQDEKWEKPGVINKVKAEEIIERFSDSAYVQKEFSRLQDYWEDRLNNFALTSGDPKLDRVVNTWNQYQCMVTFNLSRSASFFESGIGRGMGFRDSNQDLLGVFHLEPKRARERIIDIASTQFEDGSAYHQYQPLTKRGNSAIGANFNDDPLWLLLSVTAYIKETGDYSILTDQVPFNNVEGSEVPLFEHLTRSFNHAVNNLGPHGLPLIGRADWNDCLNLNCFSTEPNESFQTTENNKGGVAESLMIAGMFVAYGQEYARLCRKLNNNDEAKRIDLDVAKMVTAIKTHGWDGDWFLRAYDAHGNKVGSCENEEGKIFIESQGFCVMAGVGVDDGKAVQALDAVAEFLACEYGVVLNWPAYSTYHLELGEISTYPKGFKENGGIFCHNNPWIMISETVVGRGDQAFEYYAKLAPSYKNISQELHKTEPYVYSQMVAGKESPTPGEAKNSWLTGTAAWNYHAITQHILGIKPDYDGLKIEPCIPKLWEKYSVNRVYRGVTYSITIENPKQVNRGVNAVYVDGTKIDGDLLPLFEVGSKHDVRVVMG